MFKLYKKYMYTIYKLYILCVSVMVVVNKVYFHDDCVPFCTSTRSCPGCICIQLHPGVSKSCNNKQY